MRCAPSGRTVRRRALLAAIALILLAGAGRGAEGERTLTGEYMSGFQDNRRPLAAVFTAAGDGHWQVDFHFRFNGRNHTFSGTAEGSLSEGRLEGRVKNDVGRRTFTFRGDFKDGLFTGTHHEVDRRGREKRTGTLTLQADGHERRPRR